MNFSCSQCGAPLARQQEDCFMHCSFCGSSLYLDLESITRVAALPLRISEEEAPLFVRSHLQAIAFDEGLPIEQLELLFMPFWKDRDENQMIRASGEYSEPQLPMPAIRTESFFPEQLPPGAEILSVDTRPLDELNLVLIYVPFYRISVSHGEYKYSMLCNAVTGDVTGEAIPFDSGSHVNRTFRTFMSIFLLMLIVNFLFEGNWVLLSLNAVCLFLAYQISVPLIEKRLYK